jgi:hypothetical protein
MCQVDQFVVDGQSRAHAAIESKIHTAIEAEFAERWQAAYLWRRFWLRREMNREIERRLNKASSRYGLY